MQSKKFWEYTHFYEIQLDLLAHRSLGFTERQIGVARAFTPLRGTHPLLALQEAHRVHAHSPADSSRFYADRVVSGHRDHRDPDRAPTPRRAEGTRGRRPDEVLEQ